MWITRGAEIGTVGRAPRFSVIVPAYDCADQLRQCLAALAGSDFDDFECIVVDDASPRPLNADVDALSARLLRLDSRGGPARARNRGAAQARGDILVFFDADVCPHADALRRFDAHFSAHPHTVAVMGSYDCTPTDPGFVSQFKNLFHHYVHQHSNRQASTFWAGCGAIRRPVFLEIGGFDESYTRPSIEDIELGSRLNAAGQRVELDPEIQVTHLKRWTLMRLLRTDVVDRAVPWLLLMLRNRSMPADLNATFAHRLSVVLVWFLIAALLLSPWTNAPDWPIAATAAVLLLLNFDLYRFFSDERGVWFALRALLLHWLYYAYCGVAVGVALIVHVWRRFGRRGAA